jgi:methylaspartate mutase sigma subunit
MPNTFVLGVVGSDAHCVANQLLERELLLQGYSVQNLGVALSPDEIIAALRKISNPILLLGTLNGDLNPTISTVTQVREEFSQVPVIVGGNFVLGEGGKDRSLDLLNAGANLVIKNCSSIEEAVLRVNDFCINHSSVLMVHS